MCFPDKGEKMAVDYQKEVTMDPSGFVLLADYVPAIIQEIRDRRAHV